MALVVKDEKSRRSSSSSFRAERKPWMLRDYLKDDMSSCSSNGFRSFPRKQCCAAVKNIIENEINRTGRSSPKPFPNRNRNISFALQRASMAVIKAVKLLPFTSSSAVTPINGNGNGTSKRTLLPRSFSKKLLKRSFFWKKSTSKSKNENDVVLQYTNNRNSNGNGNGNGNFFGKKSTSKSKNENDVVLQNTNNHNGNSNGNRNGKSNSRNDVVLQNTNNVGDRDEIRRWISSGVIATNNRNCNSNGNSNGNGNCNGDGDGNGTSESNSNSSNGDGKSSSNESWSDITTFTSGYLTGLSENDVVKRREKVVDSVLAGDDSTTNDSSSIIKDTWCDEKTKIKHDELSPISVMDFPSSDDGSASPFTLRESRLKGTKERLMERLGRFESLASGLGLDPVNLETLLSSTRIEDHDSPKHSTPSCSSPSYILSSQTESDPEDEKEEDEEEEESREDEEERRVQNLLNIIILKNPNYKLEHDNLLQSYFRDNVVDYVDEDDVALLKSAEDWLDGHYDRLILGWEVKDKRRAYLRDMEERGRWSRDCRLENEEVAIEFGDEVLATLMEEVIVEHHEFWFETSISGLS